VMKTARPMGDAATTDSSVRAVKLAIVGMMPQLRVFARSLTRNPATADDLVQDTIVKSLTSIGRFRVGSNLRAWLFTILRNTFYSDLRKRRREVEDVDGLHAARLTEPARQDGFIDLEEFKRAFAQLQADHREVLTLIGSSGCSYEEAAEICGCPVGTIKSRTNRARRRLSELMGVDLERYGEEGSCQHMTAGG
jgi:RNA polymerase sigma-70 factor, ECF subfamily